MEKWIMEQANKTLQEALFLREKIGWSIIPLAPKSKKPLVDWKQYQKRKATRLEIIGWFKKWPEANIGVVTGEVSGIVVVDIDPRNGGSDKEFHRIVTVQAKSGGDGRHYFFLYETGIKTHKGVKPGIDLLSDSAFVVVAPSIHPSGKSYEWAMSPHAHTTIIRIPEFVKGWISDSQRTKQDRKERVSNWNPGVLKGVGEGKRNESAASIAGKLLSLLPFDEWEATAWPLVASWNTAQNESPLSDYELRTVFDSIASREEAQRQSFQVQTFSIPKATQFLQQDFGNVDWLVEELVPTGGSAIFVAKRESYKTWLALYVSYCITQGLLLWGKFLVTKCKVLYISNDDPVRAFKKRIATFGFDDNFFIYHQALPVFTIEQDNGSFASVKSLVEEEEIGLVIVDIVRNTHNKDSNTDKEAKAVFDKYKELREANQNLVFIFLIHPSKENTFERRYTKRQNEEAIGSYYWEAAVDTVLSLTKTTDENFTDKILIQVTKNKQSEKKIKPFIGIQREFNSPIEFIHEENIPQTSKLQAAKDFILGKLGEEDAKRQELIDLVIESKICEERTAEAALKELVAEQLVTHTTTKPHTYSLQKVEHPSEHSTSRNTINTLRNAESDDVR